MMSKILLTLAALCFGCGGPGGAPSYCSHFDLDRGVVFDFDETFRKWIAPHGTTNLWERARALAPAAFSSAQGATPIRFVVKMAWQDRAGQNEIECTQKRNQLYTHAGETSIYVCNFYTDAVDGAGTDPWTGGYGYGSRARILAHEALHGLACRPDHLPADQQGIMCGTPQAPAITCSKGLRGFTAADKEYGCGQWVSGGFCDRQLAPIEP
jgi:hypothetical protein